MYAPKKLIAYVRDLADLKDEANFGYLPPGLLRALSGRLTQRKAPELAGIIVAFVALVPFQFTQ